MSNQFIPGYNQEPIGSMGHTWIMSKKKEPKQVAVLLTFPEGITKQKAYELLSELGNDREKEGETLNWDAEIQVTEFNPDHGGVVIYQP